MVVMCCMPWLADPAHERLLVLLCTVLAAWPEPHQQSFVAALSRTTKQHMTDLVGSKLLQVGTLPHLVPIPFRIEFQLA